MFKALSRLPRQVHKNIRHASTQSYYKVDVDNETGVATLTMQKTPANTFSLEALKAMIETLDNLKKDRVKGMILTSSIPRIFSAGLELTEFHRPTPERLSDFWRHVQEAWLQLFTSSFPTAAAITGHSPAAGCLFAMACEYRVMLKGPYKIGMNETAVGILVPVWAQECFKNIVPSRKVEIACTSSQMFTSEEALQVNLIDEIAETPEDSFNKCKMFIKKFEHISPIARERTKLIYREGAIRKLVDNREEEIKRFVERVLEPETQAVIEKYLNRIKKK